MLFSDIYITQVDCLFPVYVYNLTFYVVFFANNVLLRLILGDGFDVNEFI